MNIIKVFFEKNIETIISGLIVAILGALLFRLVKIIIKTTKKPDIEKPKERAVYLNEKTLEDKCLERKRLLKEVCNAIIGTSLSFGNHIAIVGQEGIGKTLFCQTLFNKNLLYKEIYIGWIECNGKQSIFEIIRRMFKDPSFKKKNEDDLLRAFSILKKPCVIFIDQVDQYTPMEDLEKLSRSQNITLVISGLLKKINFIDKENHFELKPLSNDTIRDIFEQKHKEDTSRMGLKKDAIFDYIKGNPFLANAFAKAKVDNNNSWEVLYENISNYIYDYEDEDSYINIILKKLYKIDSLQENDKSTLSKLAVSSSPEYVEGFFEWCSIPLDCVTNLRLTHWLEQKDSLIYIMDDTRKKVIRRTLGFTKILKDTISSITEYIDNNNIFIYEEFRLLAFYIEDIMIKIKGNTLDFEKDPVLPLFTFKVAEKYRYTLDDDRKCLEWLSYCNPSYDNNLMADKALIEFQAKRNLLKNPFAASEVELAYSLAKEKAKVLKGSAKDSRDKLLHFGYCYFLYEDERYSEAKLKYDEYFKKYGYNFDDYTNCRAFASALKLYEDDLEYLKKLVKDDIIDSLSSKENKKEDEYFAIAKGELFESLINIYVKCGNLELAKICQRQMIILWNKYMGFFNNRTKNSLGMSDGEFAEYMHSHVELENSLQEAIRRKDAKALYIEGRYEEKREEYAKAFEYYQEAARHNNLSGMCSLAVMYYRGQLPKGEAQSFSKAHEYWNYCIERGHRGSYYWLGILLLDEKYDKCDKKLAMEYLNKAAEMGSEIAKEKLLELERYEETQLQFEEQKFIEQSNKWVSEGLCRHCGGQMSGLLNKKCRNCGKSK